MIHVIRCGHDSRHTKPLDVLYRQGIDHYLLLLIKSSAYVEKDGVLLDVPPQTAVIFGPGQRIHYGCRHSDYNDDWIHFSVTADDPILRCFEEQSSLADHTARPDARPTVPAAANSTPTTAATASLSPLPLGAPFQPADFTSIAQYPRLAAARCRTALSSSPHSAQIQDALMHAMLWELLEHRQENEAVKTVKSPYYPALSRLRAEIYNAPGSRWEAASTAQHLNLSLSYFQHLYKELFGIPFGRDVILARLEASRFYLEETHMDIASVAALCGYENQLHFMRQFKKFTGLTPSQYRLKAAGREKT